MDKATDFKEIARRRSLRYVAVDCDGCDGVAYVEPPLGLRLPLSDEDQEISIPEKTYKPVSAGWCLDFSGHYGGFTDDVDGRLYKTTLCHDCSLKIARLFPSLFQSATGYHSMDNFSTELTGGGSCCEFAWSFGPGGTTLVGDGHGGWRPRE